MAARLLLEGERTYGRHREIDAIDPEQTIVFVAAHRCNGC